MKRQTQIRFHLQSNSPSCKTSLLNESKIKSLPLEPLIKTDGFPCVTVTVRTCRSRRSSEVQSLNTEYMLFQLHNKRRLMSVGPNFSSTLCVQIRRLFCVPLGIKSHFPICVAPHAWSPTLVSATYISSSWHPSPHRCTIMLYAPPHNPRFLDLCFSFSKPITRAFPPVNQRRRAHGKYEDGSKTDSQRSSSGLKKNRTEVN